MSSHGKHGGFRQENNSIVGEFDWSDTGPSIAIINGIAAVETVDSINISTELNTTLFDYIDSEALNTLVSTADRIEMSFNADNYGIQIDGGELAISFD
ncbi:HalOD1 output domain-containing protein [Natronococcus wangiae]|uniref:HalOD1 output domain-containing protein n=1 Tax=Natronococcus wangiae TaxID=3068275 RepID=UPI00387E4924